MTAAGPVHDSALDALGYAVRVLTRPAFLWAPILLSIVTMLPYLALPVVAGPRGVPGSAASPMTPAELDAYWRAMGPMIAVTVLLALVLGPIASAVAYRLAISTSTVRRRVRPGSRRSTSRGGSSCCRS